MKLTTNKERGSAFILVAIVMLVTGIWIASLSQLTTAGKRIEGRRTTMNETLASADASIERAWARWRAKCANGSSLPSNAEMNTNWTDAQKVYVDLNEGVTINPSDVSLRQIDPVGRIMKDDKFASPTAKTDVRLNKPQRSVAYVASVLAVGSSPIGGTTAPLRMRVNRVFLKSDIPMCVDFCMFFDTLIVHNGPDMKINGTMHSNKRIYLQPDGKLNIFANMSGPTSTIDKAGKTTQQVHDALMAMVNQGKQAEIRGFYEDMETDNAFTGIDNARRADSKTQLLNGAHYQASGTKNVFDPNDSEYQEWWADNDADGIPNWKESANTNTNISGGYRELIEKPVTNSDGLTFPSGKADTLFIASKRYYNLADLKIEYKSTLTAAEKTAYGDVMIDDGKGGKKMNPKWVTIYYKKIRTSDVRRVTELPPNPSQAQIDAYNTAKNAAIKDHMEKVEVTGAFKDELLTAMTYNAERFYDKWVDDDITSGTKNADGRMDILDLDFSKLTGSLDGWMDGTKGNTNYKPSKEKGPTLYITDLSSSPDTADGRSKGVRIINGEKLPTRGLTLATDMLAYVRGDYNTGGTDYLNTGTKKVDTNNVDPSFNDFSQKNYDKSLTYRPDDRPSAILADNIRLQSNAWRDTDTNNVAANASATRTTAAPTTYNFAMIMGTKFTNNEETDYGGVHNFPRFMENWSGKESTIISSFIQIWESKYMNMKYSADGKYYGAPNRNWGFPPNFLYLQPPDMVYDVKYTRGRYWYSTAN